ncbi:hypothetical protein Tco_1394790 [Tanacetum coccineum]
MASTRAHCTPNACTPKPRNIYRSSPVSKCSGECSIVQEFKEFKSDEHASNDVWTKQFKPRSSSKDVWIKRFKPRSLMSNLLASLQALFLKVKKGVRLQRKGKYCKPPSSDKKRKNESDSTIPDPSHQTVTLTPPVIAPLTDVSSTKPSSLVTPPPINTEATTITTYLPEITPFIALQLRVARLEQEMSEEHNLMMLSLRFLNDTLPKNLMRIYSVLPGPESIKNQESEKSPKEIIIIKRELHQVNRQNDDDDEGPSAGSNQGRSAKRRRPDSAASRSAQPPPKDDDQSSKKLRESDASASKQHPALTSTGWQMTDTRD